ncbi:MAG TPA: AAA family ATPase, partial [Polyangiales bacterium]|nr:AAA family ATPase [Polyangiales bacterium]
SSEGQRYYTMELLAGDDLQRLAPLPYRHACAHLRDVATCLALLHARRLLHRDVSPRNVRLDANGRAKLIDFGALGDFGLAREIVGTPPYMPAEAVHQLPLDQRSDLFSLGATLYFALTKHRPFAVHGLADIDAAQRTAPLPPSKYAPDIPEALDQLVLSLLSADPLRRPSSAAEVIDRLAAIAGLDAEPLTGLAESHLLSSALIGRTREKNRLQQHVARAMRGEGSVLILDGAPGMGRTRLASELSIDARIAGLTTLRIDALAHPEPAGTLRALSRSLLETTPLEATEALPKYVGVLGQAFEELALLAEPLAGAARLPRQPTERKALIQRTFVDWLLEVCRARPLLLVIDDAHAVDSDSAGALVLIAHSAPQAKLLLAITKARDAPAPVPIQQLTRVAARVRLHGLDKTDIDQLIASVFGDVPHRARLAQWLGAAGRGNPGHSLELLKQLVDRGLIRYVGGAWALPASLPEQELPQGLDEALHARIRTLGEGAQRLASLLALHRGALPLRVCLELDATQSAAQIVATLDQLVGSDILVRSDDAYRFGSEATRARLLRDLAPETLAALHAALAQALIQARPELFEAVARRELDRLSTQDLGLLLQAASHLERGGDATRGRALMSDVAVELTFRGDGLNEAVPALEATVAEYRRQQRSVYELLPLLVPLTLAGTYSDFRLSYRYGDQTLDLLLDTAGLTWARRMRPWLGGPLALWLGLIAGFLRFCWLRARVRGKSSFAELILGVLGTGTALLGTFSVLLDREHATRVAERLDILRYFPEGHPVRWVHNLQQALFGVTFGAAAAACDAALSTFEALRDERRMPGIRGEARLQLQVGCLTPVSLAYGLRVDGKVHDVLAALDQLHTSVSRQIAAGSRATYHGHRGERSKFITYHELTDMLASQAGSTWREDVGTPRQMWSTYVLCEDVLGLKRASHDLDPLAEELPTIRKLRDATRACYLCERGMHEQALREYRSLFEAMILEPGLQGARYAGAYARLLRIAGEPERAKQVCVDALARLSPADREFRVATFSAELELLLSTAALGALDEAARDIEQLIEAQREHDNPLLHGLSHKARAQVALLQRDAAVFAQHLAEMEAWFRRTDNPALIGQCQRLTEQAKLADILQPERGAANDGQRALPELAQIEAAFEACRGPAERLRAAIDLVLSATGAERGYLYLLEPAGLRFAAPLVGAEPPETVRKVLEERIERLRQEPSLLWTDATFAVTVHEAQQDTLLGGRTRMECTSQLLAFPAEGELVVVGALALVRGAAPLATPEASLLESIARAIYDSGDVKTVYFDASNPPVTIRTRKAR